MMANRDVLYLYKNRIKNDEEKENDNLAFSGTIQTTGFR